MQNRAQNAYREIKRSFIIQETNDGEKYTEIVPEGHRKAGVLNVYDLHVS